MKNSDDLPHDGGETSLRPESPCIGQCSTTYGDDICKGCGRTFLEVINWIIFDEKEKAAIWARLEKARAAVSDAQGCDVQITNKNFGA